MTQPPARIPEQPWEYPPAHAPTGEVAQAPIGGYYARGPAVPARPVVSPPIWQETPRSGQGKKIAAFILAGLGVLLVLFFTMLEAGLAGTLIGALVALVPLALVLAAVHWLDRWEPEPRLYLFLSFAWGAGVATATAMYFNTKAFQLLADMGLDPAAIELIGVGVVAPIVEELLKGGALLAIVLWRRRLLNSAVDLIVYASTIASGFAFTENILYFARGSSQGMLGAVFFGRAIMSPFAHIMFTSATALLLATVLFSRRSHAWWAFPVGLSIAVALHATWNITASITGAHFITWFLILHVPVFLTFVLVVVRLRARERRHIVEGLTEYAGAGWFAAHEVQMLGSLAARSRARSWAADHGVRAAALMSTFQETATSLALNRRHMAHAARKDPDALNALVAREGELLQGLERTRQEFLAVAGAGERGVAA